MELIRESNKGILEPRQWWSLSDSYEAMVVCGKEISSINITDKNKNDITKNIFNKLKNLHSIDNIILTATIDSFFIECKAKDTNNILSVIETIN